MATPASAIVDYGFTVRNWTNWSMSLITYDQNSFNLPPSTPVAANGSTNVRMPYYANRETSKAFQYALGGNLSGYDLFVAVQPWNSSGLAPVTCSIRAHNADGSRPIMPPNTANPGGYPTCLFSAGSTNYLTVYNAVNPFKRVTISIPQGGSGNVFNPDMWAGVNPDVFEYLYSRADNFGTGSIIGFPSTGNNSASGDLTYWDRLPPNNYIISTTAGIRVNNNVLSCSHSQDSGTGSTCSVNTTTNTVTYRHN